MAPGGAAGRDLARGPLGPRAAPAWEQRPPRGTGTRHRGEPCAAPPRPHVGAVQQVGQQGVHRRSLTHKKTAPAGCVHTWATGFTVRTCRGWPATPPRVTPAGTRCHWHQPSGPNAARHRGQHPSGKHASHGPQDAAGSEARPPRGVDAGARAGSPGRTELHTEPLLETNVAEAK